MVFSNKKWAQVSTLAHIHVTTNKKIPFVIAYSHTGQYVYVTYRAKVISKFEAAS